MTTFQEIIHQLSSFWGKNGCAIQQGHDLEVGAGTFNPATFLRSLGPEPYNTAYVEPSRRPQDGRYGENPNRTSQFHQMQVVMKPSPENIQQIYLNSLEAIGFDLKQHDIRFVHDDWESPTLGAWGLGWEVWMDGMEVTQFTYFQAVAGYTLNPISVEITYGLERLCMALQGVKSFFDMQWNDTLTYGDIFHRSEVEWSHYHFTRASTEMWLRHFDDFENEAKTLSSLHLPIPAYDFVMKASHAFNILEARGVLSTTERTGYISRIRNLAQAVATSYLKEREKQNYPLIDREKEHISHEQTPFTPPSFNPKVKHTLLLEIGSEELPATFVPIGCRNLERAIKELFKKQHLSYQSLKVMGSPRRLSILLEDVPEGTEDEKVEKRGPLTSIAFDENGILTKQGAGFFNSLQLPHCTFKEIEAGKTPQLEVRNGYLFAKIEKQGKSTLEILHKHLPELILNLHFPKKMRWGALNLTYARPLRWIVCLLGNQLVPFNLGPIATSTTSYGHMQRDPSPFEIPEADGYLSLLEKHFVQLDIEKRKNVILKQLSEIEKKEKGSALEKERVLSEVLYLSEWPELVVGNFDPNFLNAPSEVLISEMVEHQRYFPFADKKGTLLPKFIITADNTPQKTIIEGNQSVLSARLSDGVFLYEHDLEVPLDGFNEKLQSIIFQKELGSYTEKVERIKTYAQFLHQELNIGDETTVIRAARLCKADLASELVYEFPHLQGTAGKYYALHHGENKEVANAIEEHWMPKSENGTLPQTPTGILLSLADKFDNLTSYFRIGLKPTSSSDPYALRRQTLGILKILIENKLSLDLEKTLKHGTSDTSELLTYITTRAKTIFEEYGFKKDEIEASLQGQCLDPYDQYCKVKALHAFRESGDHFNKLFEVFKRAKGQLEKGTPSQLDPKLFDQDEEKKLFDVLEAIKTPWTHSLKKRDYESVFKLLASLQDPLAALFDHVKILADDPKVQQNRLALLKEVFTLFATLLDFNKIQA